MAITKAKPSLVSKQNEVLREQLDRLAEIGGKLTTEDDIVFEGTKFIIPIALKLPEAVRILSKRAEDEESMIKFSRVYTYRPFDGAHATMLAIRQCFGFTQGKTIRTFFGDRPPQLIDVQTGVDTRSSVPWGAMIIPGLQDAVLHLMVQHNEELGQVFAVSVECRRKDRFSIEGLFIVIQDILDTNSIYRGKAIDGAETPGFLDVSAVDFEDVIYTKEVMQQLETLVWSPIKHAEQLAALRMGGKRTTLLEGTFGTGKTLAAYLTAKVAIENGYTFIMCRPGKDDPFQVLMTARMYQPAVVFIEDVDTFTGPGADRDAVTRVLDVTDGMATKGLRLNLVMTTNHAELIHKGMIRPGRLDGIIHIGYMDREGVERLAKRVIGSKLDPDTNFDEVFKAMEGYTPAFVKEAFDRAVRYSIARNDGRLGPLSTEDLVGGANGLRDHHMLMEGASEIRMLPGLDGKFAELIRVATDEALEHRVDGAEIYDSDGEYFGRLNTQ